MNYVECCMLGPFDIVYVLAHTCLCLWCCYHLYFRHIVMDQNLLCLNFQTTMDQSWLSQTSKYAQLSLFVHSFSFPLDLGVHSSKTFLSCVLFLKYLLTNLDVWQGEEPRSVF